MQTRDLKEKRSMISDSKNNSEPHENECSGAEKALHILTKKLNRENVNKHTGSYSIEPPWSLLNQKNELDHSIFAYKVTTQKLKEHLTKENYVLDDLYYLTHGL